MVPYLLWWIFAHAHVFFSLSIPPYLVALLGRHWFCYNKLFDTLYNNTGTLSLRQCQGLDCVHNATQVAHLTPVLYIYPRFFPFFSPSIHLVFIITLVWFISLQFAIDSMEESKRRAATRAPPIPAKTITHAPSFAPTIVNVSSTASVNVTTLIVNNVTKGR